MPVDVYAADEQRDHPVDLDRWVSLARSVLLSRGVKGEAEVSLLFVDEAAIAALNEQFLGKEGPTDVLAFPIEDEPVPPGRSPDFGGSGPGSEPEEEPLTLLGDVVVCPSVAARNAVEHEVSLDDEVALLVVHGLLHLLGMDHQKDDEAEQMEALERTLLAKYHAGSSGAGGADGVGRGASSRAAVMAGVSGLAGSLTGLRRSKKRQDADGSDGSDGSVALDPSDDDAVAEGDAGGLESRGGESP